MNEKNSFFDSVCDMLHEIESYHDLQTRQHEERTGKLMSFLGKAYGLDGSTCALLNEFGEIHDIGKIFISETILGKPSPLSLFEKRAMEQHPLLGYDLIKKIAHPHAELAGIIILTHHEYYDGSGYPKGLVGKAIPIEGCICTICDVYDALREERPYRKKLSHPAVFDMMYDKSGKGLYHKFHPKLMDYFKDTAEQIKTIYTDN